MRPVATAVVEAGLIPEEALDEMARWGVHITTMPNPKILNDRAAIVNHIREAIESSEQVRIDETDLDLLSHYMHNQVSGRLVVMYAKRHHSFNVTFCKTVLGEIAFSWTRPDPPETFADGRAHLMWSDEAGDHDVYFEDARDVHFGKKRMFIVCTVMKETK